ncbi:MAG TPA: hypothetical protein VGH33_22570 [Isosphaeraceae bacterium]|jgi:hypothetical protein
MATVTSTAADIARDVLDHLLHRIDVTPAMEEPFGHIYLQEVFPSDIYAEILASLPDPSIYAITAERHHKGEAGSYNRSLFPIAVQNLRLMSTSIRDLWRGIAAGLTAPELKRAMYAKLARDLAFRYGVPESKAAELPGYSRPTLYRETEGFEIPPHPDTRKKVITMHLYFPADLSQLDLGTALYRRKRPALPFGDWRRRFEKMKQFPFRPNSGYAFVVNNKIIRKSWHGREELPPGTGVRNTLLNTYYEAPRDGFDGYLA